MNQEHRFELVDTGLPRPAEPVGTRAFAARARQQRADAAEAMIASASRSVTEALVAADAGSPLATTARHPGRPDALQRSRARRHRHRAGAHPPGRQGR